MLSFFALEHSIVIYIIIAPSIDVWGDGWMAGVRKEGGARGSAAVAVFAEQGRKEGRKV